MEIRPVVPLEYSGPRPADPRPPKPINNVVRRRLIGALRQLIFAAGLMMFAQGLGEAISRNHNMAETMGMGAFLVGIALPLRRGDRVF